ncbi:MAG: type V CRISPR-associated protein Cas4 [Butyribacter sp.]|nr:type V CRISPR-associated protein Cas4 [bacterium]MDY3854966.1 type V CRISPR-associated protein Cas4 [Butyribacter sp.]
MDDVILITELNDFIFCPASIYFHHLYGSRDTMLYQNEAQIKGTNAHMAIDTGRYSSDSEILQGLDVYCEEYRLLGKIDVYDGRKKILRERKRQIKTVYDGYIFQLYAQYFSLIEMGYEVRELQLYSMADNKVYFVKKPSEDKVMLDKFEKLIQDMRNFQLGDGFIQDNIKKCANCIYEPACDRGKIEC